MKKIVNGNSEVLVNNKMDMKFYIFICHTKWGVWAYGRQNGNNNIFRGYIKLMDIWRPFLISSGFVFRIQQQWSI